MSDLTKMLRGKKILITQSSLRALQGSETIVLELAEFFQGLGANVKVFTWYRGKPMWGYFREKEIDVIDDEEDEFFETCDYVWVQHQVLPQSLIRRLADKKAKKPKFIFLHMSAHKELIIEQPYIDGLEAAIASKILFVSREISEMFDELGLLNEAACPKQLFPNPAPMSYMKMQDPSKHLSRVLIVSNHPPDEIVEAKKILQQAGIRVVSLGQDADQYSRVTANLLEKYDAVLTIGKTTQYCLVGGKPVYIYDKFGGPGYLNNKNFELAKSKNFSGRGFNKKTSRQIADEIINGYATAREYSLENQAAYQEEFLLSTNLEKVFNDLQPRNLNHLSQSYWQYVSATERFAREKAIVNWRYHDAVREVDSLKNTVTIMQGRINELEFLLNNALSFPGSRYVKKIGRGPKKLLQEVKNIHKKQILHWRRQDRLRMARKRGWKLYKEVDNQLFLIREDYKIHDDTLAILTRIRNEELLLCDSLEYFKTIGGDVFVYDDYSTDRTFELVTSASDVKLIIANLDWRNGRTAEETRSRSELLNEAKTHSLAKWFYYTDMDERIMDNNIRRYLEGLPDDVDGVIMRLFDAYMTEDDNVAYENGDTLKNFRQKFGPEYRDILTFFRNKDYIYYQGLDAREPIGARNVVNNFYCQHYGKALSCEQWQETCEYYMTHFDEPYKTKWRNRLGKAIHKKSDWGGELYNWGDELFQHEEKLMH